jgi:hypothetical protein
VDDIPEKNPFWGACSVTLCRPALGWGIGTVRFGDFILRDRRLTVVLSTLTRWVEGLVARGGRTGRSSPLGTHGNGTVWRGEITGGLTRGFAIAPSRVLNNKVELGG